MPKKGGTLDPVSEDAEVGAETFRGRNLGALNFWMVLLCM
jgi:hypothetical protein